MPTRLPPSSRRPTGSVVPSVLVNNAGITRDARADAMDVDDFRLVVRVNLVAPLRLAEAVADQLPDGGTIVNVSSRAALGNFGQANYVAAKSALIGATRALAVRLAPRVRVNAVAPGLVDTPMTQAMPAHVLDKLVNRVPAGRAADPREIAGVVGFLCAPASAYVTGQVLLACGAAASRDEEEQIMLALAADTYNASEVLDRNLHEGRATTSRTSRPTRR
jgi:NAD(P)-dependent dehydrogenase (short-subunit alcohol dehydrogenase family)